LAYLSHGVIEEAIASLPVLSTFRFNPLCVCVVQAVMRRQRGRTAIKRPTSLNIPWALHLSD